MRPGGGVRGRGQDLDPVPGGGRGGEGVTSPALGAGERVEGGGPCHGVARAAGEFDGPSGGGDGVGCGVVRGALDGAERVGGHRRVGQCDGRVVLTGEVARLGEEAGHLVHGRDPDEGAGETVGGRGGGRQVAGGPCGVAGPAGGFGGGPVQAVHVVAEPAAPGHPGGLSPCGGGVGVGGFQSAEKFKARYATLGFSDRAQLDDGPMWASGFALTEVTAEVEERIAALVERAVS